MLHIIYPKLPPSSNKIYFKGTILTGEARRFKAGFSQYCTQKYLNDVAKHINPSPLTIYGVYLKFYFESLVNKTFNDFSVPESKRAKTRYKKVDLTNRIKLLEDCVRDLIAVDDSRTFFSGQEKHQDLDNPRVEAYVYEVSPEYFGIE
jgi:Holliday junction resolvase RusA-like endonuclease